MTSEILFTPEAEGQVRSIDEWWRANRAASPDLFAAELSAVVRLVSDAPDAGRRYPASPVPGVRRIVLPATRYHLYYVYDEARAIVHVLAVWSAVRGRGPRLSR